MGARRGKESLRPADSVLNVDIVAKRFGRFDALTERVASRGFLGSGLGQGVDRMTGDPERCARSFCDEHERKCVERPRPFDQLRVLEAEGMLLRDEYVADDEIVTARAAQSGRVPRVQDFALR